eukprot:gene3195-6306_t
MSSSLIKIDDGLVKHVEMFARLSWYMRWDVLPFMISYPTLFGAALHNNESVKTFGLVTIPIILCVHIFLFLISQWSVHIKCVLGHRTVRDIKDAQYLHVIAAKNAGKDRVVKLSRIPKILNGEVSIAGSKFSLSSDEFEFQKVTYSYNMDKRTFIRLEYPTVASVQDFINSNGHLKANDIFVANSKWGKNEFDIPVPSFFNLYAEHLVAPFFVFQVLCLLLWSLDEYWYYSFITLIMLMVFEAMLCKQRQASLSMLRAMRRPPIRLYVLRGNMWEIISSEHLVPGDVISLTPDNPVLKTTQTRRPGSRRDADTASNTETDSDRERIMPCDALLLRGSCVVNEAMLTGESVPQVKETIESTDDKNGVVELGEDSADAMTWRRHMLFAGTVILQHTELMPAQQEQMDAATSASTSTSTSKGVTSARYPRPPDRGCTAIVVRTGFATSQ